MTWSEQEVEVVLSMREDADQQYLRKTAGGHADPDPLASLQIAKVRNLSDVAERNVVTQKTIHVITTLSLASLTHYVNPSFVHCLIFKANICR